MSVLPAGMYVQHVPAQCLPRPERIVRPSGNGAIDGCELSRGFRDSNPGPLKEYQVLLTTEDHSGSLSTRQAVYLCSLWLFF